MENTVLQTRGSGAGASGEADDAGPAAVLRRVDRVAAVEMARRIGGNGFLVTGFDARRRPDSRSTAGRDQSSGFALELDALLHRLPFFFL